MISLEFFTIQTPAILFPTIGLLMLAYTNRFLGITAVIRKLHDDMTKDEKNHDFYFAQIQSLTSRISLIVNAQKTGMMALILCVFSMLIIFLSFKISVLVFAIAMMYTFISLCLIYKELGLSQQALDYILRDCAKVNKERIEK